MTLRLHTAALLLTLVLAPALGGCPSTQQLGWGSGKVEALLVNGGHSPPNNSYAHLVHLRRMAQTLDDAGVPPERVTVLASDGAHGDADLALGSRAWADEAWWLTGTPLGRQLAEPLRLQSSTLEGRRLIPAKKAALEAWFALRGAYLRAGDTLLLYVTDHGRRTSKSDEDTVIDLWREGLKVSELRELIARLDPEVRVITVMSQCFSGAFAAAFLKGPDGRRPRANACGFYSTVASRRAYGCYREAVTELDGHAIRWMQGLAPGRSLASTHADVLVTDGTPDVPLTTSDIYAQRALERLAESRRMPLSRLVESSLPEGWPEGQPEASIVRAIETVFGLPRLDSLEQIHKVSRLANAGLSQARRAEKAAERRLHGETAKLFQQLTNRDARWRAKDLAALARRFGPIVAAAAPSLSDADADADAARRTALREAALTELRAIVASEPAREEALDRAQSLVATLGDARFRIEARQAALERVLVLATSAAARALVAEGTEVADDLAALQACERWSLPGSGDPELGRSEFVNERRMPPLEEDLALAREHDPGHAAAPAKPAGPKKPGPRMLTLGAKAPALDGLEWVRGGPPKAGRAYIAFFWATWCKPCKAALPSLRAFAQQEGLEIVALSRDPNTALTRFFSKWTAWFPARVARATVSPSPLFEGFGVPGLPTFYLVGADGTVAGAQRGFPRDGSLPGLGYRP